MGKQRLRVSEVAAELGVSRQCVWAKYIKKGQLAVEWIDDVAYVTRKELTRFKNLRRPQGVPIDGRRRHFANR